MQRHATSITRPAECAHSRRPVRALHRHGLLREERDAQTSTLPSTGTIAITTYESAGLYWQSPGGTAAAR
jgi:hypothetical protein